MGGNYKPGWSVELHIHTLAIYSYLTILLSTIILSLAHLTPSWIPIDTEPGPRVISALLRHRDRNTFCTPQVNLC